MRLSFRSKNAKFLLMSAAVVACLAGGVSANAQTRVEQPNDTATKRVVVDRKFNDKAPVPAGKTNTYWESETRSIPPTGGRTIDFMKFDMNGDGILSINEIGKMLFKLYDTDGNQVIDNREYERRSVVTIVPMEKNTVVAFDFDNDGVADRAHYTYDAFMRETMLTKFDKNLDGLSPREFMNVSFRQADRNNDKVVDFEEWQASYIPSLARSMQRRGNYND